VTLINTNGMAFIGPGSEWFWTALSGLVLAITFFAIYRQLRLQRSQAAIAQVTAIRAEWTSKTERHTRLAALIDLEHRAPADGMPPSAYGPSNWFDRQGYLVQKGHLDLEEASSIFTDDLLFWWTICEPFVRQDRAHYGIGQILGDFEFFATEAGRLWKAEKGSAYLPIKRSPTTSTATRPSCNDTGTSNAASSRSVSRPRLSRRREPAPTPQRDLGEGRPGIGTLGGSSGHSSARVRSLTRLSRRDGIATMMSWCGAQLR
jgi:hypothetical protein